MKKLLYLLTRRLPTAILCITVPFSEAPNPPDPQSLPEGSNAQLAQELIAAGKAADDRARAAAPVAGLLGTIAGIFKGLEHRTVLVVLAGATILAALFAQSARVEQNPGAPVNGDSLTIAAYALRRKEAWSRVASYLAFLLAAGLIVLVLVS